MNVRTVSLLLPLAACGPAQTGHVALSSADVAGHAAINALDASWGTGNLVLNVRSGSEEVAADVDLRWRGPEPQAVLDVTGDGLVTLGNTCASGPRLCATDFDVVSPVLGVTSDIGTGDVTISGSYDPVDVKVGTGSVSVSVVAGTLKVDVGTGDVTGSHVAAASVDLSTGTGTVDASFDGVQDSVGVDVGTGDVGLRFTEAPVDVLVFAGTGDVTVEVPAGSYALDLTSGTGKVDASAVTDDPTATSTIKVSVGTGDVTVRATN